MKKDILKNKLNSHLKVFSEATGIDLFYLKTGGIFSEACNVECCPYSCKRKCFACLEAVARTVIISDKTEIVKCKMGLSLVASPLYLKKQYKGAFFIQPFFLTNGMTKDEYAESSMSLFGTTKEKLLESLVNVPVFTPEKIAAIRALIGVFQSDMQKEDYIEALLVDNDEETENVALTASIINEIRCRANVEFSPAETYKHEAEFENSVKCGERESAENAARAILSETMLISDRNIEILKYKIMQMTVIMNRVHMNKDNVMNVFLDTAELMSKISAAQSQDALIELFIDYMNEFLDVTDEAGKNINYTIATAKDYIRKNCTRELTLKEVAEKVFLSSSYFSRVFKIKTGEKFIDYLNRTRIEESLLYLKDLNMDMAHIAKIMGFSDQSYYTKVFKRFMGVSPNVYRKNYKLAAGLKKRKEKYRKKV